MTEGLCSWWAGPSAPEGLGGHGPDGSACSRSGEGWSGLRTGTDTGITRGSRLSSRGRLAPAPSLSATAPRPGAGWVPPDIQISPGSRCNTHAHTSELHLSTNCTHQACEMLQFTALLSSDNQPLFTKICVLFRVVVKIYRAVDVQHWYNSST